MRQLVLARLYLDAETKNLAEVPLTHPSRSYISRLVTVGSVDRSIPVPSGLIQTGDATIEIADTDGAVRAWFDATTPYRRLAELKLVAEGASESAADPFYIGEISGSRYVDGRAIVTLTDIHFSWISNPIPPLLDRDNFPNVPDNFQSGFLPIIFGRVESYVADANVGPQGVILCPLVDTALFRYAVARHEVNDVLAVYRSGTDNPFLALVDISEYTVVTESLTVGGITYTVTLIEFLEAQPDGSVIRADVSGVDYRGIWGPLPAVSGELRNPVDALINLIYYILLQESRIARFNTASFVEVRDLCTARGYLCDGAFTEAITAGDAVAQICSSFLIDLYQDAAGQLAIAMDTVVISRPLFGEDKILKGSMDSMLPTTYYNRIRFNYARDYAAGEWGFRNAVNNDDDQAEIGLGEGGVKELPVDLHFIRDEGVAEDIVSEMAGYYTLRSWPVEFTLPLPAVLDEVDLTSACGVTHFGGIPSGGWLDEEFKIHGLVLDLKALTMHVRAIKRYDPGVLNLSFETAGHAPHDPQTPHGVDAGLPNAPVIGVIRSLAQLGLSRYEFTVGVDLPGTPVNWNDIRSIDVQVSTDNTFVSFPVNKSLNRSYGQAPPATFEFSTNFPDTYYARARVRNRFGYSPWSTTLTRSTDLLDGLTNDTGSCSVTNPVIAVKTADTDNLTGTQIRVRFTGPTTNRGTYFGYTILSHDSGTLPSVTKLETGTAGALRSGVALLTDLTKTWTPNAYLNKYLVVFDATRSGSPSYEFEGQIVLAKISANDATTITFSSVSQNLVRTQTGLTYFIVDEAEIFWWKVKFATKCILDEDPMSPAQQRMEMISPSYGAVAAYVWVIAYNAFGTGPAVATTPTNITFPGLFASEMKAGQLTTVKFASDYTPVQKVAALPTLPDALYPAGMVVYLTGDSKLYRSTGSAWTKAADGGDLVAGSVTADKITVADLAAIKVDAGALTAGTLTGLLIRTGTSGARVELDSTNGLRAYDASGVVSTQIRLGAGTDAGYITTSAIQGPSAGSGFFLQDANETFLSIAPGGISYGQALSGVTDFAFTRAGGLDIGNGVGTPSPYKSGGSTVINTSLAFVGSGGVDANVNCYTNSRVFQTRYIAAASDPDSHTMGTSELMIYKDTDTGLYYLLYKDPTGARHAWQETV